MVCVHQFNRKYSPPHDHMQTTAISVQGPFTVGRAGRMANTSGMYAYQNIRALLMPEKSVVAQLSLVTYIMTSND